MNLSPGIYEALLDARLQSVLSQHPELRSILGKLDPEEEPARLAVFVSKVLEQALKQETDSATRVRLCNEVLHLVSRPPADFLADRRLIESDKPLLLEITPEWRLVCAA